MGTSNSQLVATYTGVDGGIVVEVVTGVDVLMGAILVLVEVVSPDWIIRASRDGKGQSVKGQRDTEGALARGTHSV